MIKVLIADQHPIFAEGLRLILKSVKDIECAAVVYDSEEVISLAREMSPDVVITGTTAPYIDSLNFVKQIKSEIPNIRVVLLSELYDHNCIKASISVKVDGLLLKRTAQTELVDTIRLVYSGKSVFDSEIADRMFNILNDPNRMVNVLDYPIGKQEDNKDDLSNREMQVLSCVAAGMSNKVVASRLRIRPNTVACHLRNVYKKLGVDSRTAAVACAIAMDLVNISEKPLK